MWRRRLDGDDAASHAAIAPGRAEGWMTRETEMNGSNQCQEMGERSHAAGWCLPLPRVTITKPHFFFENKEYLGRENPRVSDGGARRRRDPFLRGKPPRVMRRGDGDNNNDLTPRTRGRQTDMRQMGHNVNFVTRQREMRSQINLIRYATLSVAKISYCRCHYHPVCGAGGRRIITEKGEPT